MPLDVSQVNQPSGLLAPSNVYTIGPGPEYDRWVEALAAKGSIRIPKELDNPQEWLGQPHIQNFINHNGVGRQDLPDGSVILTLPTPTS